MNKKGKVYYIYKFTNLSVPTLAQIRVPLKYNFSYSLQLVYTVYIISQSKDDAGVRAKSR